VISEGGLGNAGTPDGGAWCFAELLASHASNNHYNLLNDLSSDLLQQPIRYVRLTRLMSDGAAYGLVGLAR